MSALLGHMRSLRIKLFLPLALFLIGVLFFLWQVLLPHTIEVSVQNSQALLQRTLGSVSEAVTPLVKDHKLDDIYISLDHVKAHNPEWVSLALYDDKNQLLYPKEKVSLSANSDALYSINHVLKDQDTLLGTLKLVYDFSDTAKKIERNTTMLIWVLIVSLSAFIVVATSVLYTYILKPALELSVASEALMHGDYDVKLPKAHKDEMGQLVRSFAKMRDNIKSTTLALQHEKRQAEKIAQIPDKNPNPVIQMSLNGEVLYANPAALLLFSDIMNAGFSHPLLSDLDEFKEALRSEDRVDELMTREVHLGSLIYHQIVTSADVGGVITLLIYCYDITLITATQEKAFLLEEAVEAAHDGILITTPDINNPIILYANDAMRLISGYETSELIGQSPKILQGPMTSMTEIGRIKEALSQGNPYQGEIQNYNKSGVSYWLDISIVPIKDDNGEVTHFAAIERDITMRKAFEKELQINREAAEVANRSKDSFLANMSHELRTPMNGIIGLSEMMIDMDLSPEAKELADAVNSSSRNLLILLNDILDLSKIEAKELTLEYIPFNIRFTTRQTIDLLRPLAARKNIVLEHHISQMVPDFMMGDPARLQQILNNLIGNAIKFTSSGFVRLDVSACLDANDDKELYLRVEDTGIGISNDQKHTIFHKFNQADTSTNRKFGGTGLGLSITKELVEMMGGSISFDSKIDVGTVFHVRIPLEEANGHTSASLMGDNTASSPLRTDAKMMVVDDHPVNLLFMQKVLSKLGFEHVDSACTGREAIELSEQNHYDLILMDCQMPEMDGFEASIHIREHEEDIGDITIIAVTADAMKGARERCIDAGMNDYISKPVDTEKLRSILAKWIPDTDADAPSKSSPNKVQDLKVDTKKLDTKPDTTPKDESLIDWSRLDLFSDGDQEERNFLINLFITHADDSISQLEIIHDDFDEEWKKAAHKFKGSAANLGAYSLSELCSQAELNADISGEEKQALLVKIKTLYQSVKEALMQDSVL